MMWRRTIRRLNGVRRVVKVRTASNGNELVRVIGNRNYTDRTAPRRNALRRVRNRWNHPDSGRKDYSR